MDMNEVFKALGDPTRLEIISLLSESNKLCVNVIAERMGMSQPAASQHLKILKNAGILEAQKIGLYVHYSINKNKAVEFQNYFDSLFKESPKHNCTGCLKNIPKTTSG
jgi:ArsR family transcriptional regulator, arsenate/arsenite/antimonite-responsive transcriptional repressor